MENIQKSATQSSKPTEKFSLDTIQSSPQQQKVKYIAPRVKVVKTFDLSNQKDIKWFIDTYNFEGTYESDLHLYVKQGDQAYGDMGCINNAKEDINDAATPCITITCVPQGETTKANNISLLLRDWAPFDMTGSRQEKDKSFSKLGMNIANFSTIEETGVQSYGQLVQGIKNAKGLLSSDKKSIGKRKSTNLNLQRELVQIQGKDLVKSALAHMAGGQIATSPQNLLTKGTDNLKELVPQAKGAKKQGKPQKETPSSSGKSLIKSSQEKRSMPIEVSDDEGNLKRQKTNLPPSSLQLAVVDPLPIGLVEEENKALASLESKKTYYPFGSDAVFNIDVLNCFPAPS